MSGPTNEDMKWAGTELRLARMRTNLERSLRASWRGRIVLWISSLYARARR